MGDAAPAATEFDQPDSSSVNTLAAEQPTSLDSTVDTAAAKIDGAFARPALACLNEQQQFLADIQYQGIFAIALGRVWHDLEGSLAALPTERAEPEASTPSQTDELAARRAARNAI